MYVIVFNIVFFRVQVNETIKSYLFWLFISLFICWLIVQWIMRIIHQMVTKNMCDFSMPWNGNQIYEVVKERKNNRMNRWIRETLSLNYHKNIQPKWMAIETHSSQRGELNNYSFFVICCYCYCCCCWRWLCAAICLYHCTFAQFVCVCEYTIWHCVQFKFSICFVSFPAHFFPDCFHIFPQ